MTLPLHLGTKMAEFIIIANNEGQKGPATDTKTTTPARKSGVTEVANSHAKFQEMTAPRAGAARGSNQKAESPVHVLKVIPNATEGFSVKSLVTKKGEKMAVTNADGDLKDWAMGQIRDSAHLANLNFTSGEPLKFIVYNNGSERTVINLIGKPEGAMARIMRAFSTSRQRLF